MLIGTDGAVEMLDLARAALPGGREVVGALEDLWKEVSGISITRTPCAESSPA